MYANQPSGKSFSALNVTWSSFHSATRVKFWLLATRSCGFADRSIWRLIVTGPVRLLARTAKVYVFPFWPPGMLWPSCVPQPVTFRNVTLALRSPAAASSLSTQKSASVLPSLSMRQPWSPIPRISKLEFRKRLSGECFVCASVSAGETDSTIAATRLMYCEEVMFLPKCLNG